MQNSARFYVCSVGDPKKDYDAENLDRIIKNSAFVLHENTEQKGVYSSILAGDILLLKYRKNIIAYGRAIANRDLNIPEWNLCTPVEQWFFKNPENIEEGIPFKGLQQATTAGGQYGTVKEVDINFGWQKLKEVSSTSVLYQELKNEYEFVNLNKEMEDILGLLGYKKQIILQGPPGTGKTFTAKMIAEEMILGAHTFQKEGESRIQTLNDQLRLIQFHPAYSYEDFVRGITAKSKGNSVEYRTENKLLADFAGKALENQEDSKKDRHQLSLEKWLNDELLIFLESIQESIDSIEGYPLSERVSITSIENNYFEISGRGWSNKLKLSDLVLSYFNNAHNRKEIKFTEGISGLAKHRSTYILELLNKFRAFLESRPKYSGEQVEQSKKNYVIIIDEINRANLPAVLGELIYALEYRGEAVESMYDLDGDRSLILPPNLYIIGTMNTADRSVGHIDYAIRRRFAFVDILPNRDRVHPVAINLFRKVSELFICNYESIDWQNPVPERSEYLAPDFRPEDVWIGHSYFMSNKHNEIEVKDELELKLKYEILPLLKEYVKDGLLISNAEEKIKELHV